MIRRLTRGWWGAAFGLLLLLAGSGSGANDPNAIVRTGISIDYNGNVVKTYYNRAGGAARTETLGNINQPGGYHGPLPPGYTGSKGQGGNTTRKKATPTPAPRTTVAPKNRVVSTIKIVTLWAKPVRRTRNGVAYWDWERGANGKVNAIRKVGYRFVFADGGSGVSGVQGKGDPEMVSRGYRMIDYSVSN